MDLVTCRYCKKLSSARMTATVDQLILVYYCSVFWSVIDPDTQRECPEYEALYGDTS
jgi:hypothetical protein